MNAKRDTLRAKKEMLMKLLKNSVTAAKHPDLRAKLMLMSAFTNDEKSLDAIMESLKKEYKGLAKYTPEQKRKIEQEMGLEKDLLGDQGEVLHTEEKKVRVVAEKGSEEEDEAEINQILDDLNA